MGRWISADPLAVHQPGQADLNLYAYVHGAVLRSIDPLGLQDRNVAKEYQTMRGELSSKIDQAAQAANDAETAGINEADDDKSSAYFAQADKFRSAQFDLTNARQRLDERYATYDDALHDQKFVANSDWREQIQANARVVGALRDYDRGVNAIKAAGIMAAPLVFYWIIKEQAGEKQNLSQMADQAQVAAIVNTALEMGASKIAKTRAIARMRDVAEAPVPKFADYIFKPGATHGKDAIFRGLGYSREDSAGLAALFEDQARDKFMGGEYSFGKLDKYGQRIDIEIALPGVGDSAGKTSYIKSGWMMQPDGTITLNTPASGFTRQR